MNNTYPHRNKFNIGRIASVFVMLLFLTNCKEEVPEVGSIADLTPPSANFTFNQFSPSNYLEVTFSNSSVSATDYLWDFGDGNSSTAIEPVYSYAAEGTYKVQLTASDKLGATSTSVQTLVLTEPTAFVPPIKESGFEDLDLTDSLGNTSGDGRDSWKNSGLGGTIQITSSPVLAGTQAAKLTGDANDQRIGYQLLTVTENTVYDVTFNYTMLASPSGFLTVSILDGPVTTHQEALDGTIGTITVNDQSAPDVYVKETITFNTGANTEIAIYFFNDGSVETRLDDFSIQLSNGTVPPTAAFDVVFDAADYRNVTFNNSSLNATLYAWDFGDGTTAIEKSPTHSYSAEGNYTVMLTASNSIGESNVFTQIVAAVAPITVDFDAVIDATDNKKVVFTNNSVNASNYSWDFGDGNTSTDVSPTHTYATETTYSVTLSATNSIGETTTYTENVVIVNPNVVAIRNGTFDDETVKDDNRIVWRNTALESDAQATFGIGNPVLQMSTTHRSAPNSGKLPTAENSGDPRRWAYQAITVDPNASYTIKGWISNKSANVGSTVTFQIYDAPFTTAAVVNDVSRIITSSVFDASTGHDTDVWTEATITFNSGSSSEVVLFITNDYTLTAVSSETFLDDFSIVKN